jgi:hypothetical protein
MTETNKKLLSAAVAANSHVLTENDVFEEVAEPAWGHEIHSGNWASFVPLSLRELWDELSLDTKIACFIASSEAAYEASARSLD